MGNAYKITRTVRRRNARIKSLQALYQQDVAGGDIGSILKQFHETQQLERVDIPYFEEIFRGVLSQLDDLDRMLEPHLDRRLDELDPVERAILRIASFELKNRLDIPYKVVINESVELAKRFGADQGHKYVNGVIDHLARCVRKLEMQALKKPN